VNHVQVEQNDVDLIIISRRDKSRCGMRFISRGCDLDGNASNTAETEQIFIVYKKNSYDINVFSYSQLRGSIPFIWQQKPSLKWEPKGEIPMESHNVDVARKHLERLLKEYGSQVLINLIDKKGTQKKVGDEFERVVNQLAYPVSQLFRKLKKPRQVRSGSSGLIFIMNAER
jgi:Phosphoinositide polyphosphatase (Sac family)